MAPQGIDTVFLLRSELQDTLLLNPRLLAANEAGLYAFDYFDNRLKAFSRSGELRWTFGRTGGGPGEFGNALSISTSADGAVWVVDDENGRITKISAEGEFLDDIPFPPGRLVNSVVPLHDRSIATLVGTREFWVELESDSGPPAVGNYPLEEFHSASPVALQALTAVAPDRRRWASIFPVGDLLLVYSGTELVCAGRLVEGEALPKTLAGPPTFWGVGIAMSDSSVFVLARGRTAHALRMVDEYHAEQCTYRRTIQLPFTVNAMSHHGGVFYMFSDEPEPRVLAVKAAEG
jgi:hypothetical protein